MLSSKIRPAVLAIACVTFMDSQASATEYMLTASGPLPFDGIFTGSSTWDGTNLGVLPPILDLDRLAGGSFTATYLFSSTVTPILYVDDTYAYYPLNATSSMLSFDLLDVSGQLVHHGSYTSKPVAVVENNVFGYYDEVDLSASGDFNSITGSHILPPPIYSPTLNKLSDEVGIKFYADSGDYITTNLEIPTDAATYLAFPNKFFYLYFRVGDGDFINQIEPYQNYSASLYYDITALTVTAVPEPGSPGDFNHDGLLDVADLDWLTAEVRAGTTDTLFDLNGNGSVDANDRLFWITDLKETFLGDADLNRQVNASDLNQLALNWRADAATSWAQGDFNGDGQVNASDLNNLALNWRRGVLAAASTTAAVPEPASFTLLLLAGVAWLGSYRRRPGNWFRTSAILTATGATGFAGFASEICRGCLLRARVKQSDFRSLTPTH